MNNDSNKGVGDHRHVHFAPMAEMYEFEEKCGNEQISNTLWYSQKDYELFEMNRRNDIRAMKRAQRGTGHLDSSLHCMRGLVPLMTRSDTIIGRRVRYAHAVLVEQERQEVEGIVDPDRIAFASYHVTFLSCIEAEARGKHYSKEIAFIAEESTSFESPRAVRKAKWMENDGLHQTTLPPATSPSRQPSMLRRSWQRLLSQLSTANLTSQN